MAKFKVIEENSSIADGDYILTVNDGTVKKVLKTNAGFASDATSGQFVVNVTSGTSLSADHTFSETYEAYLAGKDVVLYYDNICYRFAAYMQNTYMMFCSQSLSTETLEYERHTLVYSTSGIYYYEEEYVPQVRIDSTYNSAGITISDDIDEFIAKCEAMNTIMVSSDGDFCTLVRKTGDNTNFTALFSGTFHYDTGDVIRTIDVSYDGSKYSVTETNTELAEKIDHRIVFGMTPMWSPAYKFLQAVGATKNGFASSAWAVKDSVWNDLMMGNYKVFAITSEVSSEFPTYDDVNAFTSTGSTCSECICTFGPASVLTDEDAFDTCMFAVYNSSNTTTGTPEFSKLGYKIISATHYLKSMQSIVDKGSTDPGVTAEQIAAARQAFIDNGYIEA